MQKPANSTTQKEAFEGRLPVVETSLSTANGAMLTSDTMSTTGHRRLLSALALVTLLSSMVQTGHTQTVNADCDPSKCQPLSNISEVSLEPGQRIRRDLDPCCEIMQLYCDTGACPPLIEFCDAERTVRPRNIAGSCCTLQRCDNICEVYANGEVTTRSIGEKWFNMVNETTCMNYECLRNEVNETFVNSIGIECNTICPEGFEAQISQQHCCPQCVQARCKFDEQFYREGQTWTSPDGCLLYRCATENGFLAISSSRKQCPPVGSCPEQNVIERDCCRVCGNAESRRVPASVAPATAATTVDPEEGTDFAEEQSYRNHPCRRECTLGRKPETCYYRFRLEWYRTLSKACYNCPYNATDCDRPHCIAGDGVRRNVAVINRMMPGPSIEVCENDIVVVDVENHLMGDSTTIHWHGLHQRRTPYMDGVPHVSQCPISPGTTFRYTFRADNPGTHFWHSHTGMQRGDGAFGALIIRKDNDIHSLLYDQDLSEHVITVQDWGHEQGVSLFAAHHHSTGDNKPPNLLINGRGKYFQRFPKSTPLAASTSTVEPTLDMNGDGATDVTVQPEAMPVDELDETTLVTEVQTTTEPMEATPDDVELLQASSEHSLKTVLRPDEVRHRTKRQSRTVNFNAVVVPESRHIPLAVFHVDKGRRYRFRLINAEFLNCPVELSVENHNLTVIASDGFGIQPLEDLGSFVSYAGERFDFVVKANQPVGNYLMRFRGLMDCDERFTSAYQFAVLRYRGAPNDTDYESWPPYDYDAPGVQLNSLNRGPGAEDVITIAETNALDQEDLLLLRPETDYKFYVYYDFYGKDNPHFHVPALYGFGQVVNNTNRLYTPQLNHISMRMPPVPFLPGKDVLDERQFCNETSVRDRNCREQYCECSHVIQIPLHATVEMVMIDEGFTFDANHPFHLHGHAFRVVGMDRVSRNTTVEDIRRMDEEGRLPRRLKRAPIKDTVTIPDGGYTIIRFIANNPGYWLFHCHIEFHAEIGMSLVLKVGDRSEMLPAPANFPTCYDFKPKLGELGSGAGASRRARSALLTLALALSVTLQRLL
uniref:Multicopper oxidase n=1 Tax=Anopheles dirus TaxID=7168 RepID=A0A182N4J6_9DIPT